MRLFPASVLACALLLPLPLSAQGPASSSLPELGDASSAISPEQERRLGRAWIRQLRGSVPTVTDPLVQDYLEHLTYRLSFHSPLQNPDFLVTLIDSTDINAFAVPGGVIGINSGLLLSAENEAEVAAVLAHELGHLSQRHYARNVSSAANSQWVYLGALLAGIALAANGQGDAGGVALLSTQAAMLQNELRYSRQHEQEADRIGLQTLADSGLDPQAMPRFFERLLRATRGGVQVPEFLLTHPLTESRVADTAGRAGQIPGHYELDSSEYRLMRARVQAQYATDTDGLILQVRAALADQTGKGDNGLLRFSLANLLNRQKRYEEAIQAMRPALEADPNHVAYIVTMGESLIGAGRQEEARQLLGSQLAISRENVPLTLLYARSLVRCNQPDRAVNLLEMLSYRRPDDPTVWRLLGEAYALQKNTLGLHRSRAEQLYLRGEDGKAIEQLRLGAQAAGTSYPARARLENRIREIEASREDMKKATQ